MNKNDNRISLVINTKNEEKNIKDCILSAKPIVDEIIVVDMVSTDKTAEIAEKLGAKVFKIKDYGYVEPARNIALSKASMRWSLILDADERLTNNLRTTVLKLLRNNRYDGYKFPIKNILLGKWIKHSMWWPDYRLRLFKTGYTNWPVEIHQEPVFQGKILNLEQIEKNAIVHYNIKDIKELLQMIDQYSEKETNFQSKKGISANDMVAYLDHEFKWRYFEHEGYLDGMHGFILAKFMNVYRLLEVAKFWERNGYEEIFRPLELKKAIEENYHVSAETERLRQDITKLRNDLVKIQSSKFYKFWQSYCQIRDRIKDLLS